MRCDKHNFNFEEDIYPNCPLCKIEEDIKEYMKDPYFRSLVERGAKK